jgi:hypothetical protein
MFDLKVNWAFKEVYRSKGQDSTGAAGGAVFGHSDSFNEVWAIRDISLQIEQGEALGIVGHNGAASAPCSSFCPASEGLIELELGLSWRCWPVRVVPRTRGQVARSQVSDARVSCGS